MSNDRIQWAEAKIAANEAENADLRVYIRIEKAKLVESGGAGHNPRLEPSTKPPATQTQPVKLSLEALLQRGAKKRAILTSLQNVQAAETGWIVSAIGLLGITGATMENTSPQLSAYKAEGFVDLTGDGWKITKKGREYLAEKN